MKNVFLVAVAAIIPAIVKETMDEGIVRFLLVCALSVVSVSILMWVYSLDKEVRQIY